MNVEAIRARLNAATPGPWEAAPGNHPYRGGKYMQVDPEVGARSICDITDAHAANAELIAHAPADIAALLARIEELEATK